MTGSRPRLTDQFTSSPCRTEFVGSGPGRALAGQGQKHHFHRSGIEFSTQPVVHKRRVWAGPLTETE
jgi:hypothetical protein